MDQQKRTLTAIPEDPGLIPSTYMAAYKYYGHSLGIRHPHSRFIGHYMALLWQNSHK